MFMRVARWTDVQLAREAQASNGFFPAEFALHVSRPAKERVRFACRPLSPSANNLSHQTIPMKTKLLLAPLLLTLLFGTTTLRAGTPEQEQAFTAKYKAAYETKDTATLHSFLYTEGANPMALEFYKMMMTNGAGDKISKIELLALTPEETKEAAGAKDGPGGMKTRLPLKPTKKLKITVETKDGDNTSSSTSESFVAEKDGKFVIPVPATVK